MMDNEKNRRFFCGRQMSSKTAEVVEHETIKKRGLITLFRLGGIPIFSKFVKCTAKGPSVVDETPSQEKTILATGYTQAIQQFLQLIVPLIRPDSKTSTGSYYLEVAIDPNGSAIFVVDSEGKLSNLPVLLLKKADLSRLTNETEKMTNEELSTALEHFETLIQETLIELQSYGIKKVVDDLLSFTSDFADFVAVYKRSGEFIITNVDENSTLYPLISQKMTAFVKKEYERDLPRIFLEPLIKQTKKGFLCHFAINDYVFVIYSQRKDQLLGLIRLRVANYLKEHLEDFLNIEENKNLTRSLKKQSPHKIQRQEDIPSFLRDSKIQRLRIWIEMEEL